MLDKNVELKQAEYIKGLQNPLNIKANIELLSAKVKTLSGIRTIKTTMVRDVTRVDNITRAVGDLQALELKEGISIADWERLIILALTEIIKVVDVFNANHGTLNDVALTALNEIIEIVNGLCVASNTPGKVANS